MCSSEMSRFFFTAPMTAHNVFYVRSPVSGSASHKNMSNLLIFSVFTVTQLARFEIWKFQDWKIHIGDLAGPYLLATFFRQNDDCLETKKSPRVAPRGKVGWWRKSTYTTVDTWYR
jgi:hypothetical protein